MRKVVGRKVGVVRLRIPLSRIFDSFIVGLERSSVISGRWPESIWVRRSCETSSEQLNMRAEVSTYE